MPIGAQSKGVRSALGCVFWALTLPAAAADMPAAEPVFTVFGIEQGLPSTQTTVLTEDHRGRIWVGTNNGLARYDGHRMRSFAAQIDDPSALQTNSIEAITTDRHGRVWIATQGGYLARFDDRREAFERIDWGHRNVAIFGLAGFGDDLLIGTVGQGLMRLDLNGKVHPVVSVPTPDIIDLVVAGDSAWIVTLSGELWHVDPEFRASKRFGGSGAMVYGIDAQPASVRFTTRDGRLCRASRSGPVDCQALPAMARPGRARAVLTVDDEIWIGGEGELLRISDRGVQRTPYRPGAIGGVPRFRLFSGLLDRHGGIWLTGGGGGLLHLSKSARRFSAWPANLSQDDDYEGQIRGVLPRPNTGSLWLATQSAGLIELGQNGVQPIPVPGLDKRVWAFAETADGVWIAHQSGLVRLDDSRRAVAIDSALLAGPVVDLLGVVGDELWAGSIGEGVNRIAASGAVEAFRFGQAGLSGTEIQQISAGPDRQPWLASDAGLYRFDQEQRRFDELITGFVDAFSMGPLGVHIFVDGELRRYRWEGGLFQDEIMAPRRFRQFQSIGAMHDDGLALWLIGPQGLYRFDPARGTLESFDRRDGLTTPELSDRPAYVDANGRVYVGGLQGVNAFDPADFTSAPAPAELRFETIRVVDGSGERLAPFDQTLALVADHRSLSVDVRLNTLDRSHGQRFAFRLSPRDSDWPEPGADPRIAFGTLAPGDYRLLVRAVDGFGQPAANELSLPIQVAPPTWQLPVSVLALLSLLGLFWAFRVILKRRERVRTELADANRQAQWAKQLAAERSALVAELSHEIRNPLNGILGMGRLLARADLPAENARHVALLNAAGGQLVDLLDGMLDWSRLDAEVDELVLEPIDLASALGAILDRYRLAAEAKGLAFDGAIADRVVVSASGPRLRQIVDNLLSNAIKYTPVGRVALAARQDGDMASITVSDTGPGLSDQQLGNLFTPFARGAGERLAPGTGLGLALSKRLAERMGGSLSALPAQRGARFELRLPLAAEQVGQSPAQMAPGRLDGMRLLLVEDDPIAREALETELRAAGAEVDGTADALSALLLQIDRYHAALLDWDLPGMSGIALAPLLKQRSPALVLVATTARTTPADLDLARENGFAAHIAKPIRIELLIAQLQSLCGGDQGPRSA